MQAGTCAIEVNLTFYQGSRFRHSLQVSEAGTPVDLDDYTARMQIRPTTESATVLATFTSENGMLILSGSVVTIAVPSSETEGYEWETGVYDLEIVSPSNDAIRVMQGWAKCKPQVTR